MRNGYSETIAVLLLSVISILFLHNCLDDDHHGSQRLPDKVLIPYGYFYMGDWFNEGDADEIPLHEVCINSFWMDK